MGNAKSRNNNLFEIKKETSANVIQSSILVTPSSVKYREEDNEINVGGTAAITTASTAANSVGGPQLLLDRHIATKTTTKSTKANKDPQQAREHYNPKQRQQKAADISATSAVAEQLRLKQASSFWSLGSLNWNLSYSGRNSYKQRQKSSRKDYSTLQYQCKRYKTQWHKPVTNAIFSSHFKESSRNKEFHIDQLVAKGAFGVVFKVIDKKSVKDEQHQQQQREDQQLITSKANCCHSTTAYALKVLKKSKIIGENSLQQIKDEVDIQKVCGHHPFIVKQIDLWQNRYNLHILSEYIPNGELFSTIRTFSLNLIRLYLAEIALALDFLHNAGIIYRDAKPENILLTHDYHLKLTDFGLSKWLKLGLTTTTVCGTFQYMAPEILRGEPYTHAVDWWSLGIIVCRMLVDRSPDIRQFISIRIPEDTVDNVTHHSKELLNNAKILQVAENMNILPPEVDNLCHEAKDVVKRLLRVEAKKRIRSVRTLQTIAMYKNFKIEPQYCLKIRPLDIITADNISIEQNLQSVENCHNAEKAFKDF